jgi:hypothetical protein
MTDRRVLTLWVIYESPSDYPGKVVLRRQHATRQCVEIDPEAFIFDSVEEAREHLPLGLYNLGRYDMDDPAIVEVWI